MEPRILWITAAPAAAPMLVPGTRIPVEPAAPLEAIERLRPGSFDVAVMDLPIPGWDAEKLLESVASIDSGLPVLIRSAGATPSELVRLGRVGGCRFLESGPGAVQAISAALSERRPDSPAGASESEEWERMLVGSSREIRQVGHIIRLVGPRRSTVLVTGETGTGKEIAARALHLAGPRRRGPWVAINCSAVPANLLESELFGYVRGAFTGAAQTRTGRFEQAHGGTLFLDEIGDLPIELQTKLLRVLQEREVQRLGSSEVVRVDVRVVAATNRDLPRSIEKGLFREDLFYRLNVVPLPMPPLRSRAEDVPLLVSHFLEKICAVENLPLKSVLPDALARLTSYPWPGNVRQLENAVEMAVALSGDRRVLDAADFPLPAPARVGSPLDFRHPVVALPEEGLDFERTLTAIERSILEQALQRTRGNKKAAADMLRLKRTTLAAKLRSLEPLPYCN